MVDCASLEEVLQIARELAAANPGRCLRDPTDWLLQPRERPRVSDVSWIDAILTSARAQAVAALLRYFRDLDIAEEAFQEACLRALKSWPRNGPPRDAAAWLIMVGKNAAIDTVRRQRRERTAAAGRADLGSLRR